jgi:RNA polymerase sigma-70 factor (ECF subfamily)
MEGVGPGDSTTDEELMERFLAGSEEAFDELVRRYSARITNFAYRQVSHFATAEDIAQETFLAVYRKAETYKGGYSFSGWLYKIAINFCRMHFRRKKREAAGVSIEASREEGGVSVERRLVDGGEGPREEVGRKEMEEKVRRAVTGLPEKHRLVFTLSFYDGMTYEEIGALLGCSAGTVASRKHTAVKRLGCKLRSLGAELMGEKWEARGQVDRPVC